MRVLTDSEIYRTAFKTIPKEQWKPSPYGYTHPKSDKNEMCPYCKNEDTDVVQDVVYLEPFKKFYKDRAIKFTVMNCKCCEAIWSFYDI